MTRLYEYISDNTEYQRIIDKIKKDCQPFLQASSTFFTRSYENNKDPLGSNNIVKVKPRQNRRPKDTPLHIHKLLDNWFQSKFGWKVRSEGVFTYIGGGDFYGGSINYFFPIGKFKFVTSNTINDLYNTLDNIFQKMKQQDEQIHDKYRWSDLQDLKSKEDYDLLLEIFQTFVKKYGKSYTNKDLKSITSNLPGYEYEAVFKCKEYYLVNTDSLYKSDVEELFK